MSSGQLRPQQRRGRRKRPVLVFRLNEHTGSGPEILREVFLERGWREFDDEQDDVDLDTDWNFWWCSSRFRASDYASLRPWQRLNHYPKSTAITKKDSLARNMRRMKAVYGSTVYCFSPNAFNLPNDYTKFVAEYSKASDKAKKAMVWICKPADLSRGRGIFLFRGLSDLQYDCSAVVQEYIKNPLLISGYKFDLRIYVMVPSFQPLQIYIYQEGLVRFSTEKFDLSQIGNMYSHLTNTSINKHSPGYSMEKEHVGAGCKWTLTQLRHFFNQSMVVDDLQLWGKIINIVILTLLIQAPQVPKAANCFELYGFDILIDENLKPWLLEVNFSPALSSDCQTDLLVKKPLMHDVIEMLQFTELDKMHGENLSKPSNKPGRGRRGMGSRGHTSSSLSHHSRLPDLPYTPSTSTMSTTSQVSWPSTFMEEEEDEEDADSVVPLVPGCGLPSVQHARGPFHRASSPVTVDSYSSDQSSDSPTSPPDFPEPYPRIPAIPKSKTPLRPISKCSTKASRRSSSTLATGKPNRLTALNKSSNKASHKRKSKVSITSDSGISSFSNSSENSDPHLENERLQQNFLSQGRYTGIRKITSSKSDFAEEDEDDDGSVINRTQSETRKNRKSVSHVSFSKATLHHHRNHHHMSRSAVAPRASAPSYPKPWRERGGVPTTGKRAPPKQLSERVGDFFLVWPFNETSRKCSNADLDPRVVIKECQRLLKDRNAHFSTGISSGDWASPKVPLLWGPLKVDAPH